MALGRAEGWFIDDLQDCNKQNGTDTSMQFYLLSHLLSVEKQMLLDANV